MHPENLSKHSKELCDVEPPPSVAAMIIRMMITRMQRRIAILTANGGCLALSLHDEPEGRQVGHE